MQRGRRKKVVEPEMFDDSSEEIEEDEDFAMQRHRVVTEYVKQVPLAEIESNPESVEEETDAPPKEDRPAAPPDPVEQFLAGMGGSSARWEMVVYRLPRYAVDGRADPGSRERCGRIDFTEEYESEIQKRWARASKANHFQVVVKKNGQFYKQLPVYSCEPPLPEDMISAVPSSSGAAAPVMQMPFFHEPPDPAPVVPLQSPLKQFKEQLEMMRLMREVMGGELSKPAPPALDPETAVLQALAKDTDIVERLANGAMGKLLGGKTDDGDPWAAVAMEAVKNGQAAEMLRVGIESIFNGVSGLFPNASPSPTQTAAPPIQTVAPSLPVQAEAPVQSQSPEEQVLALALDHCGRKVPPQIACNRIMVIADQINDEAPAFSIDGYLQLFAEMTPEAALEVAKTLAPTGAEVAAMPHAAQWTTQLQTLLKAQLEEEADGEGPA